MLSSFLSRSSSPSLRRLLSLSSLALVVVLLPFLASAQSSSPSTCGGAGFDLSPLSVSSNPSLDLDLVYTDGNYWYGLHPCGVVKELFCPTPAAMMCEYGTTLAYNKPDEIEWTVYSASNGTETGVTMSVANGQDCQPSTDAPAQPRNISVHFVCDMGQEGKLTTVSRPSKCATEAVVRTRYACASVSVTVDSGASSSSSKKQTVAIVVSVVSVLVILALAVLCVVMCRRWRAGQAVWVKTSTNKLLDMGMDETEKSVELSVSRV